MDVACELNIVDHSLHSLHTPESWWWGQQNIPKGGRRESLWTKCTGNNAKIHV